MKVIKSFLLIFKFNFSIYGFIPTKVCEPIQIIPRSRLETPSLPMARSRINLMALSRCTMRSQFAFKLL